MSGNEETLLTELCTICHENPPKYRCPRCSTRTCSLPCTRRHKLWSQCSGVRDPAAYLKRNELANPSAFDRDFNFITGIERTIERADREVENRGVPLDRDDGTPGRSRQNDHARGEVGLQRGIENGGVRVARAPKGMTRSKQNMSHWHKRHKCLTWTVEWITPDGQKTRMNSIETCTIATAHSRALPKASNSNSKKRKLNPPGSQLPPPPTATSTPQTQEKDDKNEQGAPPTHTLPASGDTAPTPQCSPQQPSTSDKKAELPTKPTEDTPPPKPHFYLHRPHTRSKLPVLIPLHPDTILKDALRGRLVLEFPTIYILMQEPELVPREMFMLEDEYIASENEGLEVLDEVDGEGIAGDMALEEQGEKLDGHRLAGLDERKVLEVLKKDLETRRVPV